MLLTNAALSRSQRSYTKKGAPLGDPKNEEHYYILLLLLILLLRVTTITPISTITIAISTIIAR